MTIRLGGIEAGGTKWVCSTADEHGNVGEIETFPTTEPEETIGRAIAFFTSRGPIRALGIGSFGPVDVRRGSPTWGQIMTTPKPGWAHTDIASPLRAALSAPVVIDTDVNAAALGELTSGAAAGLRQFCYLTVGTGIGGGIVVDGRLVHGALHPEIGHMRIPHDIRRDPFIGVCPYHFDCLEGLASGTAMRTRWGRAAEDITDHEAWDLEAEYLAVALSNLTFVLSPERLVVGGGVTKHPGLLALVRRRLVELIGGYLGASDVDEASLNGYVVDPALGELAGVIGAVQLARLMVQSIPANSTFRA
jgi:fructokinase